VAPFHIGIGKILGFNLGGNPGIAHRRFGSIGGFGRRLAVVGYAWAIARNASRTEGNSHHDDECAASLAHDDFPLNVIKLQE
jgi:hypothetical protein